MNLLEVLFVLVLNMSVFMFGIRILRTTMWSKQLVPIIVTIWWLMHLALGVLLQQLWLLSAFSFCSLFAIMYVAKKFVLHRQKQRHLSEIMFLLNLFILKIRSGKSLRSVVAETIRLRHSSLSYGVLCVLEVVAFSQHEDAKFRIPLLQRFHLTLIKAMEEGHHARHLLENLRDEMSLLQHFRHKSGQATLQSRMQSYICLLLYFILVVVLMKWLGLNHIKPFLFSSLTLMVAGVVLLNELGRKRRWKV